MSPGELREIKQLLSERGKLFYARDDSAIKCVIKINEKTFIITNLGDNVYKHRAPIDYYTKREHFHDTLEDAEQYQLEYRVQRAKNRYKQALKHIETYNELKDKHPELFI